MEVIFGWKVCGVLVLWWCGLIMLNRLNKMHGLMESKERAHTPETPMECRSDEGAGVKEDKEHNRREGLGEGEGK